MLVEGLRVTRDAVAGELLHLRSLKLAFERHSDGVYLDTGFWTRGHALVSIRPAEWGWHVCRVGAPREWFRTFREALRFVNGRVSRS